MSASGDDLFSLRNKTFLITGAHAASARPFHSTSRGRVLQSSRIISAMKNLPNT